MTPIEAVQKLRELAEWFDSDECPYHGIPLEDTWWDSSRLLTA